MTKQKINQIVGSIGAFIGIIVFIAYIPQIFANLQGNKAQPFQPLSASTIPAFIRSSILFNLGYLRMDKRT